jgi:hypothetical protein
MENLIYWQNVAVGIDCGAYVSWFPSAPREAIDAWLKQKGH